MKRYTVEEWDEGIVVKGPIGVEDLHELAKRAKKRGFELVDAGVARALGASFVITNEKGSVDLRAQVAKDNAGRSKEDQWLYGSDTGMSSKTIFGVMTGKPIGEGSYPWDADDFGRCYRLLSLFPEWRPRLPEVAAKYPKWAGLVKEWDEMTTLYEAKKWDAFRDVIRAAYA